jgi:hypothetical protein
MLNPNETFYSTFVATLPRRTEGIFTDVHHFLRHSAKNDAHPKKSPSETRERSDQCRVKSFI